LLPQGERDQNIINFDLGARYSVGSAKKIRFDVELAFKAIRTHTDAVSTPVYYLGYTGVTAELHVEGLPLQTYTRRKKIPVNYTNSMQKKNWKNFDIVPKVTIKGEGVEATVSVGKAGGKKGSEEEKTCKFESGERTLETTREHDQIRWTLDLPRGEKAVRDFLLGNLFLFAEYDKSNEDTAVSGRLKVEPRAIQWFDKDRKEISLSFIKRFFLRYVVREKLFKVKPKEHFGCREITFTDIG